MTLTRSWWLDLGSVPSLKFYYWFSENWSKWLSWKFPPQLHHHAPLLFHEDMFWRERLGNRPSNVSCSPKSLVGSWTVFLIAESTGWLIADPHPEYWTDGGSGTWVCVTPPSALGSRKTFLILVMMGQVMDTHIQTPKTISLLSQLINKPQQILFNRQLLVRFVFLRDEVISGRGLKYCLHKKKKKQNNNNPDLAALLWCHITAELGLKLLSIIMIHQCLCKMSVLTSIHLNVETQESEPSSGFSKGGKPRESQGVERGNGSQVR